MQDREAAVVLLATTLFDYLPTPRMPVLGTSGLSTSGYVPCSSCGSRGRMLAPGVVCVRCPTRRDPVGRPKSAFGAKHGCKPCLACGGDGWRRRRPSDPEWDIYAGLPVTTKDKRVEKKPWEHMADTQRQLEHTDLLLKLYTGDTSIDVAWEERRKRQFASGSYAELLLAIHDLRRREQRGCRLFWRLYVLQEPLTLTTATEGRLEATTKALAASDCLPDPIELPRALRPSSEARRKSMWHGRTERHAAQRDGRNDQILALSAAWTSSQIAVEFGMSERCIRQIVASAA